MIFKKMLVVAGLALIASPVAAAPQAATKSQPRAQEKTYCLQLEPITGSRISTTQCRTKDDWARLGVDIDEVLVAPLAKAENGGPCPQTGHGPPSLLAF